MSFFTSQTVTPAEKILEVIYIIIGLLCLYTSVKNFKDKNNAAPIGTAVFWGILGVVLALGRWIPPKFTGALIIAMAIPAIVKRVKPGSDKGPSEEETRQNFAAIGMKVFVPAFSIGFFALVFAVFTKLGALVGCGVGVFVAVILLIAFNSKSNTPKVFLDDSARMLSMVGPLSMLPMLLASLGAIFTAAGVGQVIAKLVGNVIPAGNMTVGIIVYALAMMVFTMIMGNGFAAITVITVGIGAPFVLQYGANPVVIGMLGLTCGYCGTLCTPMAANFNIVPVAMLEMKDKWGVIKQQIPIALVLIVVQIVLMIFLK